MIWVWTAIAGGGGGGAAGASTAGRGVEGNEAPGCGHDSDGFVALVCDVRLLLSRFRTTLNLPTSLDKAKLIPLV